MKVTKDCKGSAYIIENLRCGYHECMFVTLNELRELCKELNDMKL